MPRRLSILPRASPPGSITPNAYFNRAQANVRLKKYPEARADYVKFMALAPQHAKVPEAKAMVGAIDEELAALETQRQTAAAQQAAAEQQRLDCGSPAKAEAERQKQAEIAQRRKMPDGSNY